MTTVLNKSHVIDVEQSSSGGACHLSAAGAADNDADSQHHSGAAEGGGGGSGIGGGSSCSSYDDDGSLGGVSNKSRWRRRERESSSVSEDCSVDLENGDVEKKVHLAKVKKDCRICQLSLDASNPESGFPIELGCSCKDDLAAAHKQCAEAWFKIRGNKTCEICGSTARNVVGVTETEATEQWNEVNNDAGNVGGAGQHLTETRRFWQGHRFLNFLLACMVFAFVISWLFHFNMPS